MRVLRAAAGLIAFLCAVEAVFFTFGVISMHKGNKYLLYDLERLRSEIKANLEGERNGSITGWPTAGEFPIRPHPSLDLSVCGSAWGGSFTYSDDVSDAEAWPHLLSVALRCQVDNRGVDGFGLDQTLLHYKEHVGKERFVIVGLVEPMITVDQISSWTFISLGPDKQPRANVTKPFFSFDGDRPQLIPRPPADLAAIERHYAKDPSSKDWNVFEFPHSLSVSRAIYRKFTRPLFSDSGPGTPTQRRHTALLIAEMARLAQDRGQNFVLLIIPRPEDVLDPHPWFRDILGGVPNPISGLCSIDPTDELRTLALNQPNEVMTKSGHYSAAGNKAIAAAAARGLRACGLAS
ncbi:hypothetical protein E4K64_33385 [Bradyrhizobium frederickii]|uniref:AlgX/AlgJ SGNH hydrolase-like domain-containing protein n=1 Tax=Bradyrhizobium frederickii TaxID=2560054 RepID=A0A4Y9NPU1_9BRAD|nr:hypothetical protein [Bradyrhizobium frederickii]TFV69427.1 hypothetical protein E4K64_33385 [Bradyrhizobium frederickii]